MIDLAQLPTSLAVAVGSIYCAFIAPELASSSYTVHNVSFGPMFV